MSVHQREVEKDALYTRKVTILIGQLQAFTGTVSILVSKFGQKICGWFITSILH
jgi:hypothetical protein